MLLLFFVIRQKINVIIFDFPFMSSCIMHHPLRHTRLTRWLVDLTLDIILQAADKRDRADTTSFFVHKKWNPQKNNDDQDDHDLKPSQTSNLPPDRPFLAVLSGSITCFILIILHTMAHGADTHIIMIQ